MIYSNILEAIGHTPVIRLNKMTDVDSAEILVKFEGLNAGGSIKTRTAFNMLNDAMKAGKINQNTIDGFR
jgi:cysteine synthase A